LSKNVRKPQAAEEIFLTHTVHEAVRGAKFRNWHYICSI